MSIRADILKKIHAAGGATLEDLIASSGMDRKRMRDNIKATVDDGLLARGKDVVTGLPFYTVTPKGMEALKSMPAKKISSVTPAGGGAHITGSSASMLPVGDGSRPAHPVEGAAIVERPQVATQPAAGSDETDANVERHAWREMAAMFGDFKTPVELAEYIAELRIANSSIKHDECTGFAIAFDDEMAGSVEELMRRVEKIHSKETLAAANIVEVRRIGSISFQPVFVPDAA